MKKCKTCNIEKDFTEFPKYGKDKIRSVTYRPHCKKCTYKKGKDRETIEQKNRRRKYCREYHRANPLNARVKAYQHADRKRKAKSIKLTEAKELIQNNNCYYCNESTKIKLGLDRLDNCDGHHKNNVVVCCEKCNNILSDIPFEAKKLLKSGLTQIKEKGLLDKWEIPTKRIK